MSLRFKGFSALDFAEELMSATTVTRRESKKELRRGAKDILDTSKSMAPVDEGDLEAAHRLDTVRLNRDDMEVEITVDEPYAWVQHERLEPAPGADMKRGPKSEIKNQSALPGREVGGKFLERAVDIHEDRIAQAVANTLPGE